MHKGIDLAGVPGVLDLTDVLELIIDHFNQGSLPQEDLVDRLSNRGFMFLQSLMISSTP